MAVLESCSRCRRWNRSASARPLSVREVLVALLQFLGNPTVGLPDRADSADQSRHETLARYSEKLHYVFGLPAGVDFPPLTTSVGADAALLRRYVQTARALAESAVLNTPGIGYRAHFEPAGITHVEPALPDDEPVRALAVLFRQLYANRERASFAAVSGVLRRHAAQADHDAARRMAMLDAWRAAQGKLRGRWLEGLALERGKREGLIPSLLGEPDSDVTPEEVLSAYLYGEHVHWDEHAEKVERWKRNPFHDARHRLLFLRAIGQLSAVYVGFAPLAVTATPFDELIQEAA